MTDQNWNGDERRWTGPERRQWTGPERRMVWSERQEASEPKLFRWVESLGPALVVIAGGGMAYGGIQARMDAQADALVKLGNVPVQIAEMRTELHNTTAKIQIDQAQRFSDLAQRIATVEQRSQRSSDNIQRLWEVVRANQGKIANVK